MTNTTRAQWRSRPTRVARGFTLVELLVAVTIGLIILGAVAQIFASSSATYNVEEDLARAQENGRFAMDFVTRDLRMAGYAGCVNINQASNPNVTYNVNMELAGATDPATDFAPTQHLRGFDWNGGSTWMPALPGGTFLDASEIYDPTAAGLPRSDVLVIRRGDAPIARLQTAMGSTDDTLDIPNNSGFVQDDIALVSDCTDVDIFQITNDPSGGPAAHAAGGTPGNSDTFLSKQYGADAQLIKLVTHVYFIGIGSNGGPALFRKAMAQGNMATNPPQELVDNVEAMEILYGEDTSSTPDGNADIYRTADNILATNWDRVVSVRVSIVVRTATERGHDIDARIYPMLAGTTFGPANDKRQRRVFTSTIQLRNQRNG